MYVLIKKLSIIYNFSYDQCLVSMENIIFIHVFHPKTSVASNEEIIVKR